MWTPRLICSILYKMVHLRGHDAIWRGVCHDLERILRVPDFFVIFIKHGFYYNGSGAQVLIVIYFKLH